MAHEPVTFTAYSRLGLKKLTWEKVVNEVYSDEVRYAGEYYRNNFATLMLPLSTTTGSDAYLTLDDLTTNVSPDEVVDANSDPDTSACPPRKLPETYSICTLTCQIGAGPDTCEIRVVLDDLVGKCFTVEPTA